VTLTFDPVTFDLEHLQSIAYGMIKLLASCLIYARAFVAGRHPLAATHFGTRLGAFFYGTRFIWSTMYRSTIPLRFI